MREKCRGGKKKSNRVHLWEKRSSFIIIIILLKEDVVLVLDN